MGLNVRRFLPPATKLGQGNIFRSVCQEFCPQGGGSMHGRGACMAGGVCMVGGMHGREGVCMAGGHAWWGGACVAGGWGMCGRGHAWQGACMAGGMCGRGSVHGRGADMHDGGGVHGRYYEIRSMSGWSASYWNAFSFLLFRHLFTPCRDPITLQVQNYPYWWHHDVQEMSVTIKKERKVVLRNVLFLYGIRQDQNVINLVYSYWLPWDVPILLVKLKKSCPFQRNVEFGWQLM